MSVKKFGYLVRLGGDAEVSEALERGVREAMLPAPRDNNEACRRVAMWQHTPEEWKEMRLDARRRYKRNRMPDGVGGALLVGYALVCYCVQVGFDWLWSAVQGRRRRWR